MCVWTPVGDVHMITPEYRVQVCVHPCTDSIEFASPTPIILLIPMAIDEIIPNTHNQVYGYNYVDRPPLALGQHIIHNACIA